jgi:hypothetical protein
MIKGGKPRDKDYFEATKSSYNKKATENINGYLNIYDGGTMDIFKNETKKEIIIAMRGTASLKDIITDLNFVSNTLTYTARYKDDKKVIDKYVKLYSPDVYSYYITGHSLGGGLSSALMREYPFIKEGVVYNSATQPIDLIKQNPDLTYLYIDKDPLYRTTGRFITNKVVYPYQKNLNGFSSKLIPDFIQAHKLNQFEKLYAGNIPDNIIDDDLYVQAREKADKIYKSHGLYKSAYINKEYQRLNGRYRNEKPDRNEGIQRWLKEQWISVLPYLINGEIKQCGSLNNQLIACRPLYRITKDTPITIDELIKKHGKELLIKLAMEKDKRSNIRINWEEGKIF